MDINLRFIILSCYVLNAQQSFLPSGSTTSSLHGTMSYSIGQLSIISNNNIQTGVQQTYNGINIRKISSCWNTDCVYLSSNLIKDYCSFTVKTGDFSTMSFVLFSILGIKYMDRNITNKITLIDFKSFSEGFYILKVLKGKTLIASFRIIKT